jgi:hypothetical protein
MGFRGIGDDRLARAIDLAGTRILPAVATNPA